MRRIALCLMLVSLGTEATAGTTEETIETGRLLANLLDAGRYVIARQQPLFNDKTKADKGFTPEAFEVLVQAEFKSRTQGAPIPEKAEPLLKRLLEESRKTMETYEPVINLPGLAFKGFTPAAFGTETAARFTRWSGIAMKQTAPDALLRNQKNKADAYEAAAMAKLDGKDVMGEVVDNKVRVLVPLRYDKACLACHGGPKGEMDITGWPKEGATEGQLGGAISVSLPVAP
jgi:hypothetical protein